MQSYKKSVNAHLEVIRGVGDIGPVPDWVNVDLTYYDKYIDASGIPVVADAVVSDDALYQAKYIIDTMLKNIPDATQFLDQNVSAFLIIPANQGITTLPEYKDLDTLFPDSAPWDDRAQGLGWTPTIPYASCSEANLIYLGRPADWYNESICIHEFGHTVFDAGISYVDPSAHGNLNLLFNNALNSGYITGTYTATNASEYWAESLQCWFNAAASYNDPAYSNEGLKNLDPDMWDYLNSFFVHPDFIDPPLWIYYSY